ncbi:MAG: DUF3108 domain-containing protein [Pyrinomonadaceae bacterium]
MTISQKIRSVFAVGFFSAVFAATAFGQFNALATGEKLTYHISFDNLENAGFAELQVASVGKLDGRDVVEIRSKLKTMDLVSAAFFLIDQTRTTFIAPDTGLPVYMTKMYTSSALPKETVFNFLRSPAFGYDFGSLIYRARINGGVGTYPLYEEGKLYNVTFSPHGTQHLRVDAGEFDTVETDVTSEFLTAHDLKDAIIYFTTDQAHVPVLMTFRLRKGIFRITLASVDRPETVPVFVPVPSQSPAPTPVPTITPTTPRPTPAPTPYIDNRPRPSELNFNLGETLDYRVTSAGQPAGILTLSAKERKQVNRQDTLFLTAVVTSVDPNNRVLTLGDHTQALVDPETLAPRSVESRFNAAMAALSQTATFDQRSGQITTGTGQPVEAPLGTHTPLSLIYAMRSFNLSASVNPSAAVNDTRVAVFWDNKTLIFSLRPGKPETILLNDQKVLAQPVSITTGDPQLDALALKVWLSMDSRVPLRFTAGNLQADLIKS